MTTITDRAMKVAEDSNKPSFDAERINAQIFSIEQQLDEAYNKGVDHAIAIAEMGLDHSELVDDRSSVALLNAMISKLKELKKP